MIFKDAIASEISVFSIKVRKQDFINYTYLVVDANSKCAIIVDPAWEEDKIEEVLVSMNVKLTGILLTHSHKDHTNLVDYFVAKYHCNVWMSVAEIDYYGYKCDNLIGFNQDQTLVIGGITVKVLLTPGHTKGSTCYLISNNLFSGDTLFIEGCGLCWGNGANPYDMFDSLQLLNNKIGKEVLIFPGHSYGKAPGMAFGEVLNSNIYLHFKQKDMFVAFRMRNDQRTVFSFR
jgi:glyoxylase-like metal-dependent hydrolase (beta-lactamase superfamily II)